VKRKEKMNIAPQHPAVFRNSFPGSTAAVRASDCKDGKLTVYFPNGQKVDVKKKVSCCYHFPHCRPCHDDSEYVNWANSYFPECSGPQGCYVTQHC
jgi:hypothetical protein